VVIIYLHEHRTNLRPGGMEGRMSATVDVLAVIGTCTEHRRGYAERIARDTGCMLLSAGRIAAGIDPLDDAVSLAPWGWRDGGTIVELPAAIPVQDAVGAFAGNPQTRLRGLVCVVDAAGLLVALHEDGYVAYPAWGRRGRLLEYTARATVTATQIEHTSVVSVVNWRPLPRVQLRAVLDLVGALSPCARIRLQHRGARPPALDVPYSPDELRPGWARLLQHGASFGSATSATASGDWPGTSSSGSATSSAAASAVDTWRYEQIRPLHPARLRAVLDEQIEPGRLGMVLRSSGICRLATRPAITARWDQTGSRFSLSPLADDVHGAELPIASTPGQDLVFFGLGLNRTGLAAVLDTAALADDELIAGPTAWRDFEDPFPAW
jgi:G3E family GTPase